MGLQKDLKEFIESLNSKKAEYLVVGAHALAYHGHPRYTGDLDIAVRISSSNAKRVFEAVTAFGFGDVGLTEQDFLSSHQVVQLGVPPNRIDIIMSLDGLSFGEAWSARIETTIDGIPVHMMSREHLIRNKKATGRPQDLADIEALARKGT